MIEYPKSWDTLQYGKQITVTSLYGSEMKIPEKLKSGWQTLEWYRQEAPDAKQALMDLLSFGNGDPRFLDLIRVYLEIYRY